MLNRLACVVATSKCHIVTRPCACRSLDDNCEGQKWRGHSKINITSDFSIKSCIHCRRIPRLVAWVDTCTVYVPIGMFAFLPESCVQTVPRQLYDKPLCMWINHVLCFNLLSFLPTRLNAGVCVMRFSAVINKSQSFTVVCPKDVRLSWMFVAAQKILPKIFKL